jgi:hypothetical protein
MRLATLARRSNKDADRTYSHLRPVPAKRDASRRERGDREQKVGGLWGVGRIGGGLRRAFGCEEAGVAVLPTLELAVEESASRRIIA